MRAQANVHSGTHLARGGVPLEAARAAVVLLHGRGAAPEDILMLVPEVDPGEVAYFAPAAAAKTWYPQSFLAPLEANQPWLDSALGRLDEVVNSLAAAGVGPERTALLGFSQGACLALEYACRNARRYGGIIGLSGGLIGPTVDDKRYPRSLDGSPTFLGCSDMDPHIPLERVHRTAELMRQRGAQVETRIYPGMGHLINRDELGAVAEMLARLVSGPG